MDRVVDLPFKSCVRALALWLREGWAGRENFGFPDPVLFSAEDGALHIRSAAQTLQMLRERRPELAAEVEQMDIARGVWVFVNDDADERGTGCLYIDALEVDPRQPRDPAAESAN